MKSGRRSNSLEYSRPLDVHQWSDYPEVTQAVAILARELSGLNTKQKKHLKLVILDLYEAWLHDPPMYIGYSRDRNNYQVDSRYNKLHIGYTALITVIDRLEQSDYVEHHRGFHDRRAGVGFQSRVRAKRKLIDLIRRNLKLEEYMIERVEGEEIILLKDKDGQLVEYSDTPITMLMRAQLEVINQWLERTRIELVIPDKDFRQLLQRLKRDPERGSLDFSRKRLKRIFNNNSFEEGGRFYHGWWQEVPREYRKHITINGQPTVELDYSGMHLRLLYAKGGLKLQSDPYALDIAEVPRDKVKRIVNILLNAESLASAKRAITQNMELGSMIEEVLERIFKRHEPIMQCFYSGVGVKLQYWDSMIAEQVMLYMYGHHREPVLPIHDSFLVGFRSRDKLREAMEVVFSEISLGTIPLITDKKMKEWRMKRVSNQAELKQWLEGTKGQAVRGWQEAMRVQRAIEKHGELHSCSVHTKWKGADGIQEENEQWVSIEA
jgi:hypothetical protein